MIFNLETVTCNYYKWNYILLFLFNDNVKSPCRSDTVFFSLKKYDHESRKFTELILLMYFFSYDF